MTGPNEPARHPDLSAEASGDSLERQAADLLRAGGWGILHPSEYRADLPPRFLELWKRVEPYTMTSMERGFALYQAVRYILSRNITGALVECGVWKGGSCMLACCTALEEGRSDRDFYLYDTFTGMSEPTEHDRVAYSGRHVKERWEENFSSWGVPREAVEKHLESTGYPMERLRFVEGKVEQTLERTVPDRISLLRLDTDWYESTARELEILYPRLSPGGVLIIDDYGHFTGARKAVDEYFSSGDILLTRVDYTGRLGIKPS